MKRPLIYCCVSLMVGAVIKYFSAFYLLPLFAAGVVVTGVKSKSVLTVALCGVFATVGALCFSFDEQEINERVKAEGVFTDCSYDGGDAKTFTFFTYGVETEKGKTDAKRKLSVSLKNDDQNLLGKRAYIVGNMKSFKRKANPSDFDERVYKLARGFDYKIYAEEVEVIGEDNGLRAKICALRQSLNDVYDKILPQKEAGVVKAMITGYKADIDDETKLKYQSAGISHILAISGLHISIISYIVFLALSGVLRLSKRISAAVACAFLAAYIFMLGFPTSAVRASLIFIINYIGVMIYRKADSFNSVALVAVIIILINPYNLFDISFCLSFSAYIAIVAAGKVLNKIEFKSKIGRAVVSGVLVSSAAFAATLPISVNNFYYIATYSVFANIALVWLMPIVILSATAAAPVAALSLEAAKIVILPARFTLALFDGATGFAQSLPFAYINAAKLSALAIVCYYAAFIIIYNYKDKIIYKAALGLCLAVFAFSLNADKIFKTNEVAFLDVGQGDCAVITTAEGFCAVIDAGGASYKDVGNDSGARVVLPYLRMKGIDKINALFISHFDADHCKGVLDIIGNIEIDAVAVSDYAFEYSDLQNEIAVALEKNGTPVYALKSGERLSAKDIDAYCLYPTSEIKGGSKNEGSMVLNVDVGGKKFLFTGDAGFADEEIIASDKNCDCDVLKVGHHGSKYSTSEDFLSAVTADIAVISAGKNNVYGHPTPETLARLKNAGVEIRNTAEEGAVIFRVKDGVIK